MSENERIKGLEVKVDNHEKRLEKLEDTNKLFYRLTVLQEQQAEMLKQQQKQMSEIANTFKKIDINLTKLNISHDELQENVRKIDNRVDNIENDIKKNKNNNDDSDSISIKEIIKKYINWWILLPLSILGSLILEFIKKAFEL